jgi:hypothetical protein
MIFAKLFVEKMAELDDEMMSDPEFGGKISVIRYIFYIKNADGIDGVGGFLWAARIFFCNRDILLYPSFMVNNICRKINGQKGTNLLAHGETSGTEAN